MEKMARDLMSDFLDGEEDTPRTGHTDPKFLLGDGGQSSNPPQNAESPPMDFIPEPVMNRLRQTLSQIAASADPSIPPMTPAALADIISQIGLKVGGTVQPANSSTEPLSGASPVIAIPEEASQGLAEKAGARKKKHIPDKYEFARGDVGFTEEEYDPLEEMAKKRALLEEERIRERFEEYEKALKMQEMLEKSDWRQVPDRTGLGKLTIASPAIAQGRMRSSKRKYTEEQGGEMHESPRKNAPSTIRALPQLGHNPFEQEIPPDPLSAGLKSIMWKYDRSEDPSIHMSRSEGWETLPQHLKDVKCRIFSATLMGVVKQWFQKLEENSIGNFDDLYDSFMCQFASSQHAIHSATSLMGARQEPTEGLREYAARFNMASLKVPEVETQLELQAFIRGLKPAPFFDSLQASEAKNYEELLLRIPGYIRPEEAQAAKRAGREKNKPKRGKYEHASEGRPPPWGSLPRQNFKSEYEPALPPYLSPPPPVGFSRQQAPPQRPRVRATNRLPLNRSVTSIYHILKNEHFFTLPASNIGVPIAPAQGRKLCLYHNQYGHDTENCQRLKDTIEILAQKGLIPGFVQWGTPNAGNQGGNFYLTQAGNQLVRRNQAPAQTPPPPPPLCNKQMFVNMERETNGSSNLIKEWAIRATQSGNSPLMRVEENDEGSTEISSGFSDHGNSMHPSHAR